MSRPASAGLWLTGRSFGRQHFPFLWSRKVCGAGGFGVDGSPSVVDVHGRRFAVSRTRLLIDRRRLTAVGGPPAVGGGMTAVVSLRVDFSGPLGSFEEGALPS